MLKKNIIDIMLDCDNRNSVIVKDVVLPTQLAEKARYATLTNTLASALRSSIYCFIGECQDAIKSNVDVPALIPFVDNKDTRFFGQLSLISEVHLDSEVFDFIMKGYQKGKDEEKVLSLYLSSYVATHESENGVMSLKMTVEELHNDALANLKNSRRAYLF